MVQSIWKFALKTMTINHFLEHWRTKIRDAGEICGASREAQNIKRMRGFILLVLLLLAAPGMSSKTIEGDAQVRVAVKTHGVSPRV